MVFFGFAGDGGVGWYGCDGCVFGEGGVGGDGGDEGDGAPVCVCATNASHRPYLHPNGLASRNWSHGRFVAICDIDATAPANRKV